MCSTMNSNLEELFFHLQAITDTSTLASAAQEREILFLGTAVHTLDTGKLGRTAAWAACEPHVDGVLQR